jgi:hypothetical protein
MVIWVSPITGIILTIIFTFNAKTWAFTKGNKSKIQAMDMKILKITKEKREDETIRNEILRETEFQIC